MAHRIVLATIGSLGDLHPFIAVALRLKAHGYDPVIATVPDFRDNVTAAAISFHPIGPPRAVIMRDLGMDLSEFGRRVMRDTLFILEGAIFPHLKVMYDDLLPLIDAASLVLPSSLLFSARFAAERLGVPYITVALQPMVFLSAYDPPVMHPMPWLAPLLSRLGPRATRAVYRLGKRAARRRAGPVHAFRQQLGLPASSSDPLFEGQFSSHGTLAVYSKLLAAIQPDYPPHSLVAGFAFYDGPAQALEPALADFLEAGPAPVVFTLGSFAVQFADDFFHAGLAATRTLGLRAVALTGPGQSEAYRSVRSSDVYIGTYAPYSLLFPHAQAIVHHGGIGTLGQALRAGKPQLIVPLLTDQFDNAARAVRLGVARTIRRRRYRARRVAAELRQLLAHRYSEQCAAVGAQVSREEGAEEGALMIDRLLGVHDRTQTR